MKLIPELRFPEFEKDGEWSERILGDIADSESSSLALNKIELREEGYSVYGADSVVGYIDEYSQEDKYISIVKDGSGVGRLNLCEPKSSILGTLAYIKSKDKKEFILDWIYYLMNTINFNSYKKGSGIPHIYYSDFKIEPVGVPKPKEQQKIASCLSSLDELIAAHNDKLDALKDHKKGLLQNLFPQEGETVPKVRFPEFAGDGEWEIRSVEQNIDLISGIALKSKELSDNNSGTPILRGINITEGQIRHSDEMDKFYLGDTSEMEKYLIQENDIVIGMDGSKVGKNVALISEQDAGAILIQRVARIRAINSDVRYLYQHFFSNVFRRYVDNVNTSSGIPHISAKQIRDFEIGFPPKIEEQQKIASCLSAVDELISAQQEKIEQLQKHKKGLMQGLFPKIKS